MTEYCGCFDGDNYYGKINNKSNTYLMWIFTIIIVIGLVFTVLNLSGSCSISCYEGVIITAAGVLASIILGMTSNKKLYFGN